MCRLHAVVALIIGLIAKQRYDRKDDDFDDDHDDEKDADVDDDDIEQLPSCAQNETISLSGDISQIRQICQNFPIWIENDITLNTVSS